MSILQTKFHKEFPEIFKDIELPLVDGSWVKYQIKKTDDFGGGWLTIPILFTKKKKHPKNVKYRYKYR